MTVFASEQLGDIMTDTVAEASGMVFGEVIVAIAASIIFGLAISITYIKTQKDSYSQSLAVTLTILPVILAMIILFVGSNVARAFSLAGTLTIIRFRSAPGEPKDIGFIFFDIAAGLACGVGQYMYGALFVALVCLFIMLMTVFKYAGKKSTEKILKIVIPEELDYQNALDDVMKKYTKSYKLVRVKTTDLGSLFELSYNVSMIDGYSDKQFIDELRCRNGNLSIILSLASEEPYGK